MKTVAGLFVLFTALLAAVAQDSVKKLTNGAPAVLTDSARYNPDTQNAYHLFTRRNLQRSQPIVYGNETHLATTFFDGTKRTIFLVHGWRDHAVSDFNNVLVPAILRAADANVIVVDWHAGGGTSDYDTAVANVPVSGKSVARFIRWLTTATGTDLLRYHLIGHGLGGHQVGVVGRELGGDVPYITSLDPSFAGFETNEAKFAANDGLYTEVIHTNAGMLGYPGDLGDVDFYVNGGTAMPGCVTRECSHQRSFHYLAESMTSITGLVGRRCRPASTETLIMGGLDPKTGMEGVFCLTTRASPPFSMSSF